MYPKAVPGGNGPSMPPVLFSFCRYSVSCWVWSAADLMFRAADLSSRDVSIPIGKPFSILFRINCICLDALRGSVAILLCLGGSTPPTCVGQGWLLVMCLSLIPANPLCTHTFHQPLWHPYLSGSVGERCVHCEYQHAT